jgi:hypothetical protein
MRTGRPTPPLILTPTERDTLERWTRRAKTAQAVAQRAPDPGVRRRENEHCGGPRPARDQADRRQVAESLRREAARRIAR